MKAFHLTEIKNLYGENGIIEKGLIPKNGDRSKRINDYNKAVYFSSTYYTMPVWCLHLYSRSQSENLCVLTFDIDDDDCVEVQNTEYYTQNIIQPEDIRIVHFYHGITKEEIPFIYLRQDEVYGDSWGAEGIALTYILDEAPIKNLVGYKQFTKAK